MIFIDAHIHLYNCFDLGVFFDSAIANFRNEATHAGSHEKYQSVLMLTDWAKQDWYQYLYSLTDNDVNIRKIFNNWEFYKTSEKISIYAANKQREAGVFVIAGSKIITSENLEVLALMTNNKFNDGKPMLHVLADIIECGAIPVIPWAPGKWTGKRGAIMKDLLTGSVDAEYYLCDNGNRPTLWPYPSMFKFAENKNIGILNGSDPLNFSFEEGRAGTYVFSLPGQLTSDTPAAEIKEKLNSSGNRIMRHGKLETPWRFVIKQSAMQLMKKKYRKEMTNTNMSA
jgi:hypothetical protein